MPPPAPAGRWRGSKGQNDDVKVLYVGANGPARVCRVRVLTPQPERKEPSSTMKTLHVASAQIISAGGAARTLPRMDALAQAAACLGAEVILFSEVAIHGYDYDMTPDSVRAVAEPLDGPIALEIKAMARRRRIAILAGTFERAGEAIYNSHLLAEPDGRLRVQRKHNLTEGERRAQLTPGPRPPEVFTLGGVRCAVLICADSGIDGMAADCRRLGVQVRFVPAGGGGKLADMLHQTDLATPEGRGRYEQNRPLVFLPDAFDPRFPDWGSALVAANALGPAGAATCHQGHCIIVDNLGVLRAQAVGTIVREHMHEQLINAVLHFDRARPVKAGTTTGKRDRVLMLGEPPAAAAR